MFCARFIKHVSRDSYVITCLINQKSSYLFDYLCNLFVIQFQTSRSTKCIYVHCEKTFFQKLEMPITKFNWKQWNSKHCFLKEAIFFLPSFVIETVDAGSVLVLCFSPSVHMSHDIEEVQWGMRMNEEAFFR